ncbi:hypothetical protein KR018_010984 [Drosophila ironensis]|nr:hypothetical protein KR018_010984 [Drosophila ironensis]
MCSKRKYSEIWNHFDHLDNSKAKCMHCNAIISFAGGSQGNLSRHLKNKHPVATIDEKTGDSAGTMNVVDGLPPKIHKHGQLTTLQTDKIDRQLVKMIAKGHHSLRIVEEPEFRKLMELVSNGSGYKLPTRKTLLPTRKTLLNTLLPDIHSQLMDEIKQKVSMASEVCLTTDGWTSSANENYMAISVHFIDNQSVSRASHMISCEVLAQQPTSKNLCNHIRKVAGQWQIENKIAAIVSVDAANLVGAAKAGGWHHLPCFAHTLNLVVQKGLDEIADVRTKCKAIVGYFDCSPIGLKKLRVTQAQLNLPELNLKQEVPTRWNSTYEMLESLWQLKDAVMVAVTGLGSELVLSQTQWKVIEDVLPILRPFYQITTEISAETNVSLSIVNVLVKLLKKKLTELDVSNEYLFPVAQRLQNELIKRFSALEKNDMYTESTILDPRFKGHSFMSSEYFSAESELKRKVLLDQIDVKLESEPETELPTSSESPSKGVEASEQSIWHDFDLQFTQTSRASNNLPAAHREVDRYLEEELLQRTEDPLVWWEKRKNIYPLLYKFARKRLLLVANSVPCESLFSSAGELIRTRRTFLEPIEAKDLVFLQNNM